MQTIMQLHEAVAAVCPIDGVSVGNKSNKLTWTAQFKPQATQGQKDAAQAVIDAFVWGESPPDLSDMDNLEKEFKAMALCVAQVGGLTVPQMKELFKSKWDSLP